MIDRMVGIIGVGNMGGAMAARLLDCGWQVRVRDIDAAKEAALRSQGAQVCADPAGLADGCRTVIVCVVDAQQTIEVLFGSNGAARAMSRGGAVVFCPTIAPADAEAIAARLHDHGLSAVDAPMSGGPGRARDGSMSLMVACNDAAFDENRELLQTLSSRLFRISQKPGDGARTKLVNNLAAGINLVGAAEVMAMARRMGLNLERTLDVIEQSSGQSWIGSDRMRRAIAGDYAPRAHVTLLQKDTRLAVEAALAEGFRGPLGGAARDVFEHAAHAGMADLDDAAVFRLLAGE